MRWILPLCLLGLSACQSEQIDLTGPGDMPGEPVQYARDIAPLLAASCGAAGCHDASAASGVRVTSHTALLTSIGQQYGEAVVVPGDPDASPLMDKVEPAPRLGERMPLGGGPLDAAELERIRSWIAEGAADD